MTTWIADWSRFEQWLETHKVTKWKHLLSLERHDDGYRTFLARKDIAKGSTLLEIPDHLLITGNKASKWLLKNKWISHEQVSSISGTVLIALFLFFESKQVDSFWKPYLDVLPTSYDMLFLFRRELLYVNNERYKQCIQLTIPM